MKYLAVRNWQKWQSYRRDRGQPPWVKVHRRLMNDPDWLLLTDSERGQLVSIWVLAAERNGLVPDDKDILQSLCRLTHPPDLDRFVELQWLERSRKRRRRHDAKAASLERQSDANATPEERRGQVRGGQGRAEKDPFEKKNTDFPPRGPEPPTGAHGVERRAPPAGNGAARAEKAEAYRAQLDALGADYGAEDSVERLAIRLADVLRAPGAAGGQAR